MANNGELTSDEDLWGRFLGKKYNRMAVSERTLPNLIDEFYHRRGRDRIVDEAYGSKEELRNTIDEVDTEDARSILLTLWAQGEWQRRGRGQKFNVTGPFSEELERIRNEGDYDVEELRDGTALVWVTKSVRRDIKESDDVRNRTQREAQPLFIRYEDGIVEARGARRRLNKFGSSFTEAESVTQIEPELTDESIIDRLSSIFIADLETLHLTGISFRSSGLPGGSGLSLNNPDGVQDDLNSDEIRPAIVDTPTLSQLEMIKFEHEISGTPIELHIERGTNGFYFDIRDNYLTEPQKENVETVLEDKLGISLDSLYRYDIQHQDRHIIHQILTGDYNAFEEYYEDLDSDLRAFVDRFIEVTGTNTFQCFRCGDTFEFDDPSKIDDCPDCGQTLFKGGKDAEVNVNHDAILEAVMERMEELSGDISLPDGTRLLDFESARYPASDPRFVRSTFQLTESAGAAIDTHRYEYLICPLGNGRLSSRISRYLKHCVLVTHGQAYIRGYNQFGTIGLYEFLTAEKPGELVAEAILETRKRMEKRVQEKANEARDRLGELQEKVDDGTIKDASPDEREALKEELDHDDFERDVFYLLKSLFLFTERWGRRGEAESDGCLIIPTGTDSYYVASYDPKLTYDNQGYDLDSEEKNKAAYYILTENDNEYISKVLKDGGDIDGHIFVSDIFRSGQFNHVVERVREWFSVVEGGGGSIDVPLVFLDLQSLLRVYDIAATRFDLLREYPELQREFRSAFITQLTETDTGYVNFNEEQIDRIREQLLQKANQISKKDSIK